ncbi:MAG: PilN domain-containing protein [Rhizobiales bacterium]|nr:PilN domain-containing protein [Rhizobacter sp.]
MILINLLPHREEKRKRKKIAFFAGLGVAAAAGLAIVGGWYVVVEQLKVAQQERNQFLTTEIAKLEREIKDIATLKAEIASLTARQKAVEDLQIDRNLPVHILNELVRQTPEGMYFTSVKQDGQLLAVTGIAQTQERISEFLRNTAYGSEWLVTPELIESKATTVTGANREQKRLFDFSVRLTVKRPQDKAAVAGAATTTAPANTPASGAAAAAAKKV